MSFDLDTDFLGPETTPRGPSLVGAFVTPQTKNGRCGRSASSQTPRLKGSREVGEASPAQDIGELRAQSQGRLRDTWELIFAKYGRDTSDEADEIDVRTGEIVVDRGFYRNTPDRPFGRALFAGGVEDGIADDSDTEADEGIPQDGFKFSVTDENDDGGMHAADMLEELARKRRLVSSVPKLSLRDLDSRASRVIAIPYKPPSEKMSVSTTPSQRTSAATPVIPSHEVTQAIFVLSSTTPTIARSIVKEIEHSKFQGLLPQTPSLKSRRPSTMACVGETPSNLESRRMKRACQASIYAVKRIKEEVCLIQRSPSTKSPFDDIC
ncbi:centromere protein Scm3-domain-containing protein [Chytriomyces sp. MP71]|nr:centromere protein Scm3-domain-containing protein [Chytriomyces sp. MP71]